MSNTQETKREVRARIDELEQYGLMLGPGNTPMRALLNIRLMDLKIRLETASEDVQESVILSHAAICKAKGMDSKAAYGNDPAVYYSLALVGEAGELANAVVKSLRNGTRRASLIEAVMSELSDVVIYAYVLAHVLDIDLPRLVNDKAKIVIQRAVDGYYGGKLEADVPGSLNE